MKWEQSEEVLWEDSEQGRACGEVTFPWNLTVRGSHGPTPRNRGVDSPPTAPGCRGCGWLGLCGEDVTCHPDRGQFGFVICSDVNVSESLRKP